jgi:hypothetical protein
MAMIKLKGEVKKIAGCFPTFIGQVVNNDDVVLTVKRSRQFFGRIELIIMLDQPNKIKVGDFISVSTDGIIILETDDEIRKMISKIEKIDNWQSNELTKKEHIEHVLENLKSLEG